MDILRKELDAVYAAQRLGSEILPADALAVVCEMADALVGVGDGCAVITDASCDRCHIYSGSFGAIMGFSDGGRRPVVTGSSDEDEIYGRIHPEDLVDKRLLEYEFFRMADSAEGKEKLSLRAICRLRMRDTNGLYRYVSNSTQVICLSPAGKIWLILCQYGLSSDAGDTPGIAPCILNTVTGEIMKLSFEKKRRNVLSAREREILLLIRDGKPSKQIADILRISVHTVSRHRQNIIRRLSVGNSIEAVTAATAMGLL